VSHAIAGDRLSTRGGWGVGTLQGLIRQALGFLTFERSFVCTLRSLETTSKSRICSGTYAESRRKRRVAVDLEELKEEVSA